MKQRLVEVLAMALSEKTVSCFVSCRSNGKVRWNIKHILTAHFLSVIFVPKIIHIGSRMSELYQTVVKDTMHKQGNCRHQTSSSVRYCPPTELTPYLCRLRHRTQHGKHSQNRKYISHSNAAMATATGNMQKKLMKLGRMILEIFSSQYSATLGLSG